MTELLKLHLWLPSVHEEPGGIQSYGEGLVRAVLASDMFQVSLFVKNNRDIPVSLQEQLQGRWKTFGRLPGIVRTVVWAIRCTRAALLDRPALILVGHARFAPIALLLRIVARQRYGVMTYGLEAWNLSFLQRISLRRAARVITISDFTARALEGQRALPRGQSPEILSCAVDLERFRPGPPSREVSARLGIPAGAPVLLTVARLAGPDRQKGYDEVLRILPELVRTFPEIRYILAGDGPDRSRIDALVRRLGVEERVVLPGRVSSGDLVEYYRLADVFVMPSRREGFGIVFIEAMACGTPVVAGNADAAREVVGRVLPENVVPPGDLVALKAAIERALRSASDRGCSAQESILREYVEERFSQARFAEHAARIITAAAK